MQYATVTQTLALVIVRGWHLAVINHVVHLIIRIMIIDRSANRRRMEQPASIIQRVDGDERVEFGGLR